MPCNDFHAHNQLEPTNQPINKNQLDLTNSRIFQLSFACKSNIREAS